MNKVELYIEDVIRELEFSDTDTEKGNKGKTADSKGRNRSRKTRAIWKGAKN